MPPRARTETIPDANALLYNIIYDSLSAIMKEKSLESLIRSDVYHNTRKLLSLYHQLQHDMYETNRWAKRCCASEGLDISDVEAIDSYHNHSYVTNLGLELGRTRLERELLKQMRTALYRVRRLSSKGEKSYTILYVEYFALNKKNRPLTTAEKLEKCGIELKSTYNKRLQEAISDYSAALWCAPTNEAELLMLGAMKLHNSAIYGSKPCEYFPQDDVTIENADTEFEGIVPETWEF